MASVKKMAKPISDEGSQETFRTVAALKGSASELNQLIKLSRAYHQANQAAIDCGKQLVDQIVKITTKMEGRLGDISQSLIEISALEKSILKAQEDQNNYILEQLSTSVQNQLVKERTDLANFEKNYHKRHQEILEQLRKAEKETQKAGKKSPYQLQQAIQDLTDKMNEMTEHRQQKLKEILLYERKKFCEILHCWVNVVDSQIRGWSESNQSLSNHQQTWKEISNDVNTLPPSVEELLRRTGVKERTSTSLQTGGDASSSATSYYEEEYDYYEGEGAYEESYEDNYYYNEAASTPVYPASTGNRARALYDYTGTHDYELNFKAGEIINIISEDHSTGWWIGELRGVQGPFPGNYVEKI